MDVRDLTKRLLPVIANSNWERLEDWLTYQRTQLVEELVKTQDIKRINRLQGEILMIDKILDLPNTLKKL